MCLEKKKSRNMLKLLYSLILLAVLWLAIGNVESKAAEVPIAPSGDMASAPQIAIGTSYYATMNNYSGYVSFVTPAENGYIQIYYKNISISDGATAYIKTVTGEVISEMYKSAGYSGLVEGTCDVGYDLEPGQRYYIQVGNSSDEGNVLFSVSFQSDSNPDDQTRAEEISLNKEYTRSIDSDIVNDYDYFKFTTQKNGGHRLSLSRSVTGNDFSWEIRKWTTDELAKKSDGRDASGYIGSYYSSTTVDISLEANTTYYIQFKSKGIQNYTFSINNQSVTSISIPSTAVLGAGQSFRLNPVISPASAYNKEVSYSSSNRDIAWVDSDGDVTASSSNYGTTTITVTAKDGSGVSATCRVTVRPATPSTPYVASYNKNSHTIKWSSQSGVAGYTVYVKSGKSWKAIKTTTGTSFTRTGLKSGQKCQYRIRSFIGNTGKQYSGYSGVCYASTAPGGKVKQVKAKRTRKKASSYSGSTYYATISWGKVKNATGYKVYYRHAGSNTKYLFGTTNKRSMKVSFYKSKYSNSSRTSNFYVKPIIKYHGTTYEGSMSKGKKYKYH